MQRQTPCWSGVDSNLWSLSGVGATPAPENGFVHATDHSNFPPQTISSRDRSFCRTGGLTTSSRRFRRCGRCASRRDSVETAGARSSAPAHLIGGCYYPSSSRCSERRCGSWRQRHDASYLRLVEIARAPSFLPPRRGFILVTVVTLSSIAAWHFSSAVLTINTIEQRVTKVTQSAWGTGGTQEAQAPPGLYPRTPRAPPLLIAE